MRWGKKTFSTLLNSPVWDPVVHTDPGSVPLDSPIVSNINVPEKALGFLYGSIYYPEARLCLFQVLLKSQPKAGISQVLISTFQGMQASLTNVVGRATGSLHLAASFLPRPSHCDAPRRAAAPPAPPRSRRRGQRAGRDGHLASLDDRTARHCLPWSVRAGTVAGRIGSPPFGPPVQCPRFGYSAQWRAS